MSEFKTPRTLPEIQKDYQNQALRAGHLRYQIDANEKDLELVLNIMRDLNFEGAAAKAAEDKAKSETSEEGKKEQEGEAASA